MCVVQVYGGAVDRVEGREPKMGQPVLLMDHAKRDAIGGSPWCSGILPTPFESALTLGRAVSDMGSDRVGCVQPGFYVSCAHAAAGT